MKEVICKVLEKIEIDGKDYFKLLESQNNLEHIIPLNQLFDSNLFIGSEYKFLMEYNEKFDKYFLIQEHPFYKLNTRYEFPILRLEKKECETGEKITNFVIEDNNKNEINIASHQWQENNWVKSTLCCTVIGYKKNQLKLENSDYTNLPYIIGEYYDFKIIGFGTYLNRNKQTIPSIIVENYDGSQINVTALKWQKEGFWNFDTLKCQVLKYNYNGIPYLKNQDFRHPIYKIDEIHKFKIAGFKTKVDFNNLNKRYNIIEVKGEDGCIHETNALPGQNRTLKVGDTIECVIQSIYFNIRLNQTNISDPYFVSIGEIIDDKELISKYFEKTFENIDDVDSIELAEKYNSKSAFWVFTFCNKLLTRYFKDYTERFDYKSSSQISQLIIAFENWIINNGIISSFPEEKARKATLAKAKQQLEKYTIIRDVLTILENLNLTQYISKNQDISDEKNLVELYYIFLFSDINQIDETLFIPYIQKKLQSIELNNQNEYSLIQLDKTIQFKKQKYYSNEYEKEFNLTLKINQIFENELSQNKFYAWSFCQYLINEKLGNFEHANYLMGKLLRQYSLSSISISLKEKLLFNSYYLQNNQSQIKEQPFTFVKELLLVEDNLHPNPNCCNANNENWLLIKESFQNKTILTVNVIQKQFNGFIVEFKGIRGFLPFNHISDKSLKNYAHSIIDYTITVEFILLSEEFNFFVVKQSDQKNKQYLSINNLVDNSKAGDIIEGKIKSIEDYGIFVTTYLGDGLLHRTNISSHFWDKEKLQLYFKCGDKIVTRIVKLSEKKIELSLIDLADTEEENRYYNFINYVEFGDLFEEESIHELSINDNPNVLTNDSIEVKMNQLEKAFCFEQFAIIKKDLDEKIHYLRLSKQFFSSISNSRSYLINIYTDYFELLKLLNSIINSFSLSKIDEIKAEAQKILQRIEVQTFEVYPDAQKLIFFINILSLFNDSTDESIDTLYGLLKKNSDKKSLKTIAKITLANNLLSSGSEEHSEFVKKNLSLIKSYLDEGVLSLKETETDKRERELREKVKYWLGRISEDEGETQEFKSTFKTPIPDERTIKEKEKLMKLLETEKKNDGLLKSIDKIDGELASKAVIHSSLKTLCAFANTKGGTLLIGVVDDKKIIGLEKDYSSLKNKQNRDGFGLFFASKIKEYFEPSFSSLLEREYLKFPDGDILIVNVKPSIDPVFLLKDDEGNPTEQLFIRDLTSTKEIKDKRELVKFVKQKHHE